jgi:ubiquitin C-terminal hydrolase
MSVIGLNNIGNTCFMNSALQMILNCNELNDKILESSCSGEITNTYKNLVLQYRKGGNSITPKDIKKVLASKCNLFSGFSQEDSHEFLVLLLGRMEKEFKQDNKENNTMGDILDMNITIKVKSTESKRMSSHDEILTILPLDLPNKNVNVKLIECIEEYTAVQNIDDPVEFEDKLAGDKIRKIKENGNQQHIITGAGKYLLIQLKRFVQTNIGIYGKKINLVESPDTIETSFGTYHLKSFIVQTGGMGGGHYISFINDDNLWKCADDSRVYNVTDSKIKELVKCAYMICYEKD